MVIEMIPMFEESVVPYLRKLVRARLIPFLRIGNRLKFNKASIDEWLKLKESKEGKNPLYLM